MRGDRLERALAIRDHVLPLIRAYGVMRVIGVRVEPARIVAWDAGDLSFMLRIPFTPWPPLARSYAAAVAQQRANPVLPWVLDVWHSRKVLSVQWDDAGAAEVIGFAHGPWEATALSLSATNAAAVPR